MTPLKIAALLLAALMLSACASNERKSGELPYPAKRLTQKGYAFMPPNEPYWFIAGRDDSQLLLVRQRTLTDEAVSIVAGYVDLSEASATDDLVNHVRISDQQAVQSSRYRVQEHEVQAHAIGNVVCARSYMLVEDHDGERAARTIGAILLETLTLICPHPSDNRLGVTLTYSHRFYPEDRDRQLAAKGMAMFESLEFIDL